MTDYQNGGTTPSMPPTTPAAAATYACLLEMRVQYLERTVRLQNFVITVVILLSFVMVVTR